LLKNLQAFDMASIIFAADSRSISRPLIQRLVEVIQRGESYLPLNQVMKVLQKISMNYALARNFSGPLFGALAQRVLSEDEFSLTVSVPEKARILSYYCQAHKVNNLNRVEDLY
jgi:hypothetical protein